MEFMDYNYLNKMIGGRTCPLSAENENHEMVVIERGRDDEGEYIVTTTIQHNNWCRINTYYESGTTTETYRR